MIICDKCGAKISQDSRSIFDYLFNSFDINGMSKSNFILCDKCDKKLNKVIKDWLKNGKRN